ncbi:hypothetical protein [Microvirga mediterraneensis]|uniref:Uncharacterized protein n=1 Tax=Microvirga mediterraneensis TaxID=2754695 RepID=A0A838BSG8_9HYPH|nr:hypothetical protein [Microvirga mediterraneensis]MBA1158270.1 hypothetical protein [Microvirga mediterraneensis]
MQSFRYLKFAYLLMFAGLAVPFIQLFGGIVASLTDPKDKSRISHHCAYILDTIWITTLLAIISSVAYLVAAKLAKSSLVGLLIAIIAVNVLLYLYRVISGFLALQKDVAATTQI